jgi:hypothetical protein
MKMGLEKKRDGTCYPTAHELHGGNHSHPLSVR